MKPSEAPGAGVHCRAGDHDRCGMDPCACDCHAGQHPTRVVRTLELVEPTTSASTGWQAVVVTDEHGRRLCPRCHRLLERNPNGGRYPRLCERCKGESAA